MNNGEFLNNRYQLEEELGRGGAGAIYRAYDTLLDRRVAVKVLAGRDLGSQGRARLLREAQAAARLNHPNIVSIYDAGETDGSTFIVMELVEGDSLHEKPPDSLEGTLAVFRQVCAALQHAHQNGIVHRDLKPENVLLTPEGVAKLTDFGLARPVASRLTKEGEITGTVFYLAPEQALGQEVDPRTDLYSLGVMLYEMTTGQLPFVADDPIAVVSQHLYAPVVPPRLRNNQVPQALDALIVQLMSKTPLDRPATAADVLKRLETLSAPEAGSIYVKEPTLLERVARGRIVGREHELAEVRRLWERAKMGEGQALLISGEPGIGKSRLAREMITLVEVSGGLALVGECYAEGGAPYAPFAQIFRRALINIAPSNTTITNTTNAPFPTHLSPFVLADIISVTPDLQMIYPAISPNPRLDPQAEQQRLFENVLAFFSALSRQKPCLVLIEDAHWADQASLALLRHLARRFHGQRILIIATYREVELDEARPLREILFSLNRERLASRMKITRLDRSATRQMLTALLDEPPSETLVDGIYHETEGNPFFIEEVCKALVESGDLYFDNGHWTLPKADELQLPQSVRVTIQERLGKLPLEQQELLRLAAILGREFDFETLATASEQDEDRLIDALEQAERSQLIEEMGSAKGGSFRFVHALIPLTLVEGLSGLRRRKLHKQAAEVIEKLYPDNLESLAYQYTQAEIPEKALHYLKKAGDRARSRYANDDAIHYYTNALEFSEISDRERFGLLADRTAVYHLVAQRGPQLNDLKEMQALAEALDDDRLRFESLISLIDFYTATDFTRTRQPSQEALELAEQMNDPECQGRALYRLANEAWRDGDYRRSIDYLKPALEKFQQSGQPGESIPCLHLLSLDYLNQGEHAPGQAAAERAVELSRQLNDRQQEAISLRRLGIVLNAQERKGEALSLYQQALALHREVGDRAEQCNALNAIAVLLIGQDRAEEARPYFLEGLEIADEIDNDMAIGMLVSNYVDGYFFRQSDYQGSLLFLEQQEQKASRSGERSLSLIISRMKSETLADLGLYARALGPAHAALAAAEERQERRSQIDILAWIGRLYALAGKPLDARRSLQTSLEMMLTTDEPETYVDPPFNFAYIAWLGEDPAEWERGVEYCRQVSRYWRKGVVNEALMFSLDMEARLLLALGQSEEALSPATEAAQIADNLSSHGGKEQIYYTAARAMNATGKKTDAKKFLQQAYEIVMQASSKLREEELRKSFLENIRYNREILKAWETNGSPVHLD